MSLLAAASALSLPLPPEHNPSPSSSHQQQQPKNKKTRRHAHRPLPKKKVPVTEKLLEFRELCITNGKKSSRLEYQLDGDTWDLMIKKFDARYPIEELNEKTSKALRNFENAGQKNFTLCSKTADGLEFGSIKESLGSIISKYSAGTAKKTDMNQSTFSISAVYPIVLPFTNETDKTIRKGTDGQAQGSKDLKFSDLSINCKYGTMPEQGLLIAEIKPPGKVKSGSRPDLVKLGNEMKNSIDKMVNDGIDNKDISVFGLLIEETYRLVLVSTFFIPQDRHDFARLPNCFSALSTMRV
ncbi:hypothetical protein BDA99DRAFT_605041 [Phascolomyces articulosus]|uniref:Uncharacterized protein n=1 Tax=Phascolomyces articulosus TaxID=60185 RepID=A0AAD5PEE0_9FUNG|nr:hypothetical protein BDA99DRAFT_605041 [Phascolomyces articulosus]